MQRTRAVWGGDNADVQRATGHVAARFRPARSRPDGRQRTSGGLRLRFIAEYEVKFTRQLDFQQPRHFDGEPAVHVLGVLRAGVVIYCQGRNQ